MDQPIPTRRCGKCATEKPLTAFAKAAWCADGRRGTCQACRTKAAPADISTKTCTFCGVNRPVEMFQKRASSADGYHQRCKECRSAYRRAQYSEDPEQSLAAARRWRSANGDAVLAGVKRWQAANPDRRRDYSGRRRARMLSSTVGPIDLEVLWTGTCPLCGFEIDPELKRPDPLSKSLDHIIPLALGGTHEQSNLQWTHLRCNVKKGPRGPFLLRG